VKTIDRLKDLVFEIDKKKGEYGLVLGYGSMYGHSKKPNVAYAYNKRQRHMFFIADKTIQMNEELTIDYGSEYWQERSNLNMMSSIENISKVKEPDPVGEVKGIEESEIQAGLADIQAGKSRAEFAEPNSRANPAVSGVAILGGGQS
jgi:SET domain-containing protein